MPDMVSRAPELAVHLCVILGIWQHNIDTSVFVMGLNIGHTPVGLAGCAIVVAAVIPEHWASPPGRWRVAWLLGSGGAIHLLADVLQSHLEPGYYVFYPFSATPWELGWIGSEASLVAMPVLLMVAWWALRGTRAGSKT